MRRGDVAMSAWKGRSSVQTSRFGRAARGGREASSRGAPDGLHLLLAHVCFGAVKFAGESGRFILAQTPPVRTHAPPTGRTLRYVPPVVLRQCLAGFDRAL